MLNTMTSIQNPLPAQYRARAQEARDKAEMAAEQAARHRLLRDAEMYERMAEYEEKTNPTR
jgi:hypothetical protein